MGLSSKTAPKLLLLHVSLLLKVAGEQLKEKKEVSRMERGREKSPIIKLNVNKNHKPTITYDFLCVKGKKKKDVWYFPACPPWFTW